ncbi:MULTISPECIES: DUF5522 domain-containing protein [Halobacteriovorax]|uniref:Uncharacterized protein n=1 Tax=Halobacteriovorax vibrionivorans TaxID=2152716 RepID=A0ABY0IGZ4_9BACT|nr:MULTISPECIES: DUF5522 domain-containing protein [Halobacteriovorax]AYF45087.1 hypothetical protein BALOs_2089 [Halobacteriovorax sp. BALOs_7]RZF22184.1 hypothetical protein DAY19_00010 [Halobacteriovorax vibrionivorans]TGD48436.1 hypothetical protein EP118_02925 [Halobacteriovorax sp. Y22]
MSRNKKKKNNLRAQYRLLHDEAQRNGEDYYRDPVTGGRVSTEARLKRMRKCCKDGCRHCPWGFKKRS